MECGGCKTSISFFPASKLLVVLHILLYYILGLHPTEKEELLYSQVFIRDDVR
jgi:hypothetical protein